MPRIQFDRDQVIQSATTLFRQHGFEGTSMQQVFETTKLKPGSLYLAFGNKEGLFRESLEHYANTSRVQIEEKLTKADTIGLGICQVLHAIIQASIQDNYCSCFLLKSQLELAAKNKPLYQFTGEQLRKTETMYRQYITQEYGSEHAANRACSLMFHLFGLQVYCYHQKCEHTALDGLAQGLNWLPWQQYKLTIATTRLQ